jgi:hypothetical protein
MRDDEVPLVGTLRVVFVLGATFFVLICSTFFRWRRARARASRPRVCRSARRATAASGLPDTRNAYLVKVSDKA